MLYKHSFDLGFFCLFKDEGEMALFYKVEEIYEEESPLRVEERLVRYAWRSMTKV